MCHPTHPRILLSCHIDAIILRYFSYIAMLPKGLQNSRIPSPPNNFSFRAKVMSASSGTSYTSNYRPIAYRTTIYLSYLTHNGIFLFMLGRCHARWELLIRVFIASPLKGLQYTYPTKPTLRSLFSRDNNVKLTGDFLYEYS